MDVTDASYRIRNVQNDIIGLHDSTGTVVVSYSYDTWGKLVSISGSLKDSVGIKNPYRYRGYRYDEETGLYYLQSRYYNAEWGRFINADGIVGEVNEIMSCNMFAYCMNSPVNNIDSNGEFAILAILATVTLTKVVASVLTVATVVAVGYFASAIHTYSKAVKNKSKQKSKNNNRSSSKDVINAGAPGSKSWNKAKQKIKEGKG